MNEKIINQKTNRNFVNLNMNPCKMCMPMGAVIAFRGLENSMTILHGSQGCNAYMRTHLTTHYSEPIDIASSSLHESSAIYGGIKNLKQGLLNIIKLYTPSIIGVATTCLAETIGEDVPRIIHEFKKEYPEYNDIKIVSTNTPSYQATLYEGYFSTIVSILKQTVKKTPAHNKVNIIMAHISPGDIRTIQSILDDFEISYTMLPDISETFDAPFSKAFQRVPCGGTPIEEIEKMSGARATIEIGVTIPKHLSPGLYLNKKFNIPVYNTPIPTGLQNVDTFMKVISEVAQKQIPQKYKKERGRLIDGMIDSHKITGGVRALIYGEPDLVYATTTLCLENGIKPTIISTGSNNLIFSELLKPQFKDLAEEPIILNDTDFETIEELTLEKQINLVIGNSMGKHLTEKYNIPPVRIGFPIQDRIGGQRLEYTGYKGTLKLLDDITNTMLAKKFAKHRITMLDKYFKKQEYEDSLSLEELP